MAEDIARGRLERRDNDAQIQNPRLFRRSYHYKAFVPSDAFEILGGKVLTRLVLSPSEAGEKAQTYEPCGVSSDRNEDLPFARLPGSCSVYGDADGVAVRCAGRAWLFAAYDDRGRGRLGRRGCCCRSRGALDGVGRIRGVRRIKRRS